MFGMRFCAAILFVWLWGESKVGRCRVSRLLLPQQLDVAFVCSLPREALTLLDQGPITLDSSSLSPPLPLTPCLLPISLP